MSDEIPNPEIRVSLVVQITYYNKGFYSYAKGYKDAADFLVQALINEPRAYNFQINEMVFPVVFLYTQYVELRLKHIVVLSNALNHIFPRLPDSLQTHHAISKIWSHAKPLIMAVSALSARVRWALLPPAFSSHCAPMEGVEEKKYLVWVWKVISLRGKVRRGRNILT